MLDKKNATQQFIPVEEINSGIIKLRDGSLRAILSVFSINMSLKSQDEQEAIILEFQNLLNTLEFSIQILVQSRKHDIRPYIEELEERMSIQKGELLQVQTQEYINFIRQFSNSVNIMAKHFYVVVPFNESIASASEGGIRETLSGFFSSSTRTRKEADALRFEEQRNQLEQRVSILRDGLARLGLRSEQLDTEAAIEVFYKIFNPGEEHRMNPDTQ